MNYVLFLRERFFIDFVVVNFFVLYFGFIVIFVLFDF